MMNFSVALKDYVDQLSILVTSANYTGDTISWFNAVPAFFSYVFHSFVFVLTYIFSFQWLTHFVELPAIFRHNYNVILQGRNVLQESIVLEPDAIPILESKPLNSRGLVTGILNSFFLTLPCTVPHLLSIRALFRRGLPAALAFASGTLVSQSLFFACILFGLEFILVPFFHFNAILILFGMAVLFNLIYELCLEPEKRPIFSYERRKLFNCFQYNFILVWVENVCVCHYFNNLTIDGSSTVLQTSNSSHGFLATTFFYWLGLLIGSALWMAFFGWLTTKLRTMLGFYWLNTLSWESIHRRFHYILTMTIALTALNSVPYYGMDYLLTSPLGLIYKDRLSGPSPTYYSQESLNPAEEPRDFFANTVAFDEHQTEEGLHEHKDFQAEQSWQNRLLLRTKLGEALAKKSVKQESTFDSESLVVPSHVSFGLEPQDRFKEDERLENIERVAKYVFRDDIYLHYNDSPERTFTPTIDTHRIFRNRYYSNPVYQRMVKLDMLPFLSGQPSPTTNLDVDDEFDLAKRRYVLQNYLELVDKYKTAVRSEVNAFPEIIYNQQFKGTLSIIRQYNAVYLNFPDLEREVDILNPDFEIDDPTKKVLKYDQPLYNRHEKQAQGILHEELSSRWKANKNKQSRTKRNRSLRYMKMSDPSPLYLGWDGSLRKMLVKTGSLPVGLPEEPLDPPEVTHKDGVPDYFSFQAYVPGVANEDMRPYYNTPTLETSEDDVERFKLAFEFIQEEDAIQRAKGLALFAQTGINDEVPRPPGEQRFFKVSPQYDWFWAKLLLFFDYPERYNYIDIGHVLPPKLDGVAWPGVLDRRLSRSY